jgi:hypothetical protein
MYGIDESTYENFWGWEMKQPLIPFWTILGMKNEATPEFARIVIRLIIHPQNVTSPDVTDSSTGGGDQQGGGTGEERPEERRGAQAGKDRVRRGREGRAEKDRTGGGEPTVVWKEKFFLKTKNMNQTLLK